MRHVFGLNPYGGAGGEAPEKKHLFSASPRKEKDFKGLRPLDPVSVCACCLLYRIGGSDARMGGHVFGLKAGIQRAPALLSFSPCRRSRYGISKNITLREAKRKITCAE